MFPDLGPVFLGLAFADHHHLELGVLEMEFFELRGQRVARTAGRARKHQQDPTTAQLAQSEVTFPVQSRQPELRCGRAGFQAVPLDFTASQRTVAEPVRAAIAVAGNLRFWIFDGSVSNASNASAPTANSLAMPPSALTK